MNSLSWFIYLAEVSNGFCNFLVFFAVMSFVLLAMCGLIRGVGSPTREFENFTKEEKEKLSKFTKYSFLCGVVCIIVSIFIPSKNTLMLIAASEYGQKFVESKTAQEIIDPSTQLLKEWINNQLKEIKKEK
jgi:hypothetical protein